MEVRDTAKLIKKHLGCNTAEWIVDRCIALLNEVESPENLKRILLTMSEEERMDLFSEFCQHCGEFQGERVCQCWNDE